jgi:hypothetical protein
MAERQKPFLADYKTRSKVPVRPAFYASGYSSERAHLLVKD